MTGFALAFYFLVACGAFAGLGEIKGSLSFMTRFRLSAAWPCTAAFIAVLIIDGLEPPIRDGE
jgi:hypothetical protein